MSVKVFLLSFFSITVIFILEEINLIAEIEKNPNQKKIKKKRKNFSWGMRISNLYLFKLKEGLVFEKILLSSILVFYFCELVLLILSAIKYNEYMDIFQKVSYCNACYYFMQLFFCFFLRK